MTNMPRRSVSLPQEIDDRIVALRKSDKYCRCTLSQITRQLIEIGLKIEEKKVKA